MLPRWWHVYAGQLGDTWQVVVEGPTTVEADQAPPVVYVGPLRLALPMVVSFDHQPGPTELPLQPPAPGPS